MAGKKSRSKVMKAVKPSVANKTVKAFSKTKMKKFLPDDNALKNKLMRYRMRIGL